jgi:hypothetical protein
MNTSEFYMRYLNALAEKNPDAIDVCDDDYWNRRRFYELEKNRVLIKEPSLFQLRRRIVQRAVLVLVAAACVVVGGALMR